MYGPGIISRFSELLEKQGFVLYLPDEIVEAYKQGVLGLDLSDIEIATQTDEVAERRLFEAVTEAASFRKKGKKGIDSPPPKKNFLPKLQSDFTDEQWGVIEEHFELVEKEIAVVSFPDWAAAEAIRFCLIFYSRWRPSKRSDKLCVLSANKSKVVSGPKLPEDFGLENLDKHFGTIIICRRFYTNEAVGALAYEIGRRLENSIVSAATVVEIADSLRITD